MVRGPEGNAGFLSSNRWATMKGLIYPYLYEDYSTVTEWGGAVSKLSASSVPLVVPDPREDPKSRSPNLGP